MLIGQKPERSVREPQKKQKQGRFLSREKYRGGDWKIEQVSKNKKNVGKNYFYKLKRKPIRSHGLRAYTHNSSKFRPPWAI
jgi:hypothetical protein